MADRKILYRSGGAMPEVSPSADRIRAIGMLSGAATVTLETVGGATAQLDDTGTQFNLSAGIDFAVNGTKLGGTSGDTLVGDNGGFSWFTPTAATVRGALEGIDSKLGTLSKGIGVVEFDSGEAIGAGMFCYPSADSEVSKAIATALATALVVGVAEDAIANPGSGDITTGDGALIENVQLEAGLGAVSANDEVFLSKNTAGYGTTTAPSASGEVVIKVGVIKDGSGYNDGDGTGAEMILRIEPPTVIA